MAPRCYLVPLVLVVVQLAGIAAAQDKEPAQGIAAKYPGDAGIERDPRVLFVEKFSVGSADALQQRWDNVAQVEAMTLVEDVPSGAADSTALLTTHTGGKGTGCQLFTRLPDGGGEHVFARFYVKFDRDCADVHHFGTCIGGNVPATPWPKVRAGQRTSGDHSFWVGIEPFGKMWQWDYYAYWCEMRGSPPRGQTWGNSFIHDSTLKVERDRWICVETMVKVNQVGQADGELALWIDGRPVSHLGAGFPKGKWTFDKFLPNQGGEGVRWNDETGDREYFDTPEQGAPFEGFRWRTNDELKVNFVWAYVYITGAADGHVSKIWFDNIVVAKEYIGPIAR